LERAGVTSYNPQVQDWHPHLMVLENLMKSWCPTLLFVVGSDTRAVASMIEAGQLIGEGRHVVLVVTDVVVGSTIEGTVIGDREAKDLNRGRAYLLDLAKTRDIHCFTTVADACDDIVRFYEEERTKAPRTKVPSPLTSPASTYVWYVSLSCQIEWYIASSIRFSISSIANISISWCPNATWIHNTHQCTIFNIIIISIIITIYNRTFSITIIIITFCR
jgi:hypothetical protein